MSWHLSLEELVAATEGQVVVHAQREFKGVGTDTRADLKDKVFIALRGATYDAHQFLETALAAGATALVVESITDDFRARLERTADAAIACATATVVVVPDTLRALQDLGHFWRRKMPAQILALTGTNGKTTTKEFAAAILATRLKVHHSKGSFNNHWGVPLSLLGIEPEHDVAVIEMGMNHPGELKVLSQIAEPDVICVTMVGRGHLEGLGSIEGVANAKQEVYEAAALGSVRIFNLENEHTRRMFERFAPDIAAEPEASSRGVARPRSDAGAPPRPAHQRDDLNSDGRIIVLAGSAYARQHGWSELWNAGLTGVSSGRGGNVGGTQSYPVDLGESIGSPGLRLDVSFEVLQMTAESMRIGGQIRGVAGEVELAVFGQQNVTNLMAAAALALAAGLTPAEIWAALPQCKTIWGRNQWVKLPSGAKVLFDGYNANPESMLAALENFKRLQVSGRKFAILAEMKEMGAHAAEVHFELGRSSAQCGFESIVFFGPSHASFAAGVAAAKYQKTSFVFGSYEQNLALKALPVLELGDVVLIKGSRGMQLEKVLLEMQPVDFTSKG